MKPGYQKTMAKLTVWAVAIVMVTCMWLWAAGEVQAATVLKNPVVKDKGDGNKAAVWDCVYFGHYPQSADGKGGFVWEPIKWRVLWVDGNEALLLADKNLDVLPYHEERTEITWERSTLRSWMNGYDGRYNGCGKDFTQDNFLDIAFDSDEQAAVKTSTRSNGDNPSYGTDGGNRTDDKVFLLSTDEVTNPSYGFNEDRKQYDDTRVGKNTDYVASNGNMAGSGYADYWWISTPGVSAYYASLVDYDGYVDDRGSVADGGNIAVRPALRIDLSSNQWKYAGIVSSDGREAAYIGDKTVKLSKTTYLYNGAYCRPAVTISGLKEGTDYTVTYKNNKNPGTATVVVTGTGNYTGTITKSFIITPKAPTSVTAKLYGYDDVKLTWSKTTGASGYYVYYKKSTSSKYTLYGRTTGTTSKLANLADGTYYYFKIVPYVKSGANRYQSSSYKTAGLYTLKKMPAPVVTKYGTKVKVKWTNINGESGYQISRSTSKTGTNIVATYATTKGTYRYVAATKNKTYYYKVRAYRTVDGKKIYGPWSTVKAYKRK